MSESKNKIEELIENGIFASRWLMAPVYIGLSLALLALLIGFFIELSHFFVGVFSENQSHTILGILSLIDFALTGNLLLIVIFSGYENFVSKIDTSFHKDQPEWKGKVDFNALKLKLIASIVAISGIHLLKVFMDIDKVPENSIKWMVIIHVVFVVSGVMLAFMDKIAASAKNLKS